MPQLGGLAEGIDEPGGDAKRKKDRKLAYIAIGVGVVGVIIAWLTLRKSGAGSGITTTSATGTTGAGSVADYGTANAASDASYFQAILQALTGIQQTITPPAAAGTPGPSGPVGAGTPLPPVQGPGPASQTLQGSGYWYGAGNETAIQDTAPGSVLGKWFQWLSPGAAAAGAGRGGVYYEPTPGNFQPVTGATHLLPGTPQYIIGGAPR